MKIKLFDKVHLQSGHTACIVEILGGGAVYVADVDMDQDTETKFISPEEILEVME